MQVVNYRGHGIENKSVSPFLCNGTGVIGLAVGHTKYKARGTNKNAASIEVRLRSVVAAEYTAECRIGLHGAAL